MRTYVSSNRVFQIGFLLFLLCIGIFEGFSISWIVAAITILPILPLPFLLQVTFQINDGQLIRFFNGKQDRNWEIKNITKISVQKDFFGRRHIFIRHFDNETIRIYTPHIEQFLKEITA